MRLFNALGLASCILLGLASPALAKSGHGNNAPHQKLQRLKIRAQLVNDNAEQPDLNSARGRVQYNAKIRDDVARSGQFKVRIDIPIPAPSLGITDADSASALPLHLEVSRENAPIVACTLSLMRIESEEEPQGERARFALHIKQAGKSARERKGSCGEGDFPVLHVDDQITVYAIVDETRVDALHN